VSSEVKRRRGRRPFHSLCVKRFLSSFIWGFCVVSTWLSFNTLTCIAIGDLILTSPDVSLGDHDLLFARERGRKKRQYSKTWSEYGCIGIVNGMVDSLHRLGQLIPHKKEDKSFRELVRCIFFPRSLVCERTTLRTLHTALFQVQLHVSLMSGI
jgi:hypothetical protein